MSALADEYAEHLKQWAHTVDRHTHAVQQLEAYVAEWKDAGGRVQRDASERLDALGSIVAREWSTLKAIHEEPIKELREQAAHLTQDLRAAVTELRTAVTAPRLGPTAPWPLDDVTMLHSQLRGSVPEGGPGTVPDLRHRLLLQEPSDTVVSPAGPAGGGEWGRWWRTAVVSIAVALIMGGWLGWRQYGELRRTTSRLQHAELTSATATAEAARQLATVRAESAREITRARDIASRAQRISDVLAAPDLRRYHLTGTGSGRSPSGQGLWSRTRGLVFSGSGIASPLNNRPYELWLVTPGAPVKAGTFSPDTDGTVTIVQPAPFVPGAVVGILVTTEGPNRDAPSGDLVLTSIPPVP